ncbi:MAG: CarD family transcriptional regulator [Clostridia bacterium]|nr:CarD family transcriptional regulator [Clostridia bacterium]
MYNVGDSISHPMHGAGVIVDIVDRSVDNRPQPFYLVNMLFGSMTVLIPCGICDSIGVRNIISSQEADKIIDSLPKLCIEFNDNWSKRYRENIDRIKSGDLYVVAGVIKTLVLRDKIKTLSTGERKLLNTAKGILASELALAKNITIHEAERWIISSIV